MFLRFVLTEIVIRSAMPNGETIHNTLTQPYGFVHHGTCVLLWYHYVNMKMTYKKDIFEQTLIIHQLREPKWWH